MSIRDQLASKQPHVTSIRFPRGEEGEAALKKLNDAEEIVNLQRLMLARNPAEKVDRNAAEDAVKKAQAAYAKVSIELRFRGLTSVEHSALSDEFAVPDLTDEEKAAGKQPQRFNTRGYTCVLLSVATLDSDLTAEEWDAELYESGRWSLAEVAAIRTRAQEAYSEVAAPGIPKGYGLTPS